MPVRPPEVEHLPQTHLPTLGLGLLFTGPGRISLDRALTSAGQERRVEKRVARRLGE